MNSSEEQFEELLANVVARVNKTLSKQADMVCMGLLLKGRDEIEVLLSLDDKEINLKEAINNLQSGLIAKAKETESVAACLSYPDYENNEVIVFLENKENYCAKCRIPVLSEPDRHLDTENLIIEDGAIFVFGQPSS